MAQNNRYEKPKVIYVDILVQQLAFICSYSSYSDSESMGVERLLVDGPGLDARRQGSQPQRYRSPKRFMVPAVGLVPIFHSPTGSFPFPFEIIHATVPTLAHLALAPPAPSSWQQSIKNMPASQPHGRLNTCNLAN